MSALIVEVIILTEREKSYLNNKKLIIINPTMKWKKLY